MSDIVWGNPPKGTDSKYKAALERVAERPGEWARIEVCRSQATAGNLTHHIKKGKRGAPAGKWEAVSRKIDDGAYGVWVRFLGSEE